MKLHAFDGILLVTQSHDGLRAVGFSRPGADFEFGRQAFFFDDERVIPRRRERQLQVFEDSSSVMGNLAGFAVHQVRRAHDLAPERSAQSLMPQADPQDRQLTGEVAEQIHTDAGFLRGAGSGRYDDPLRVKGFDLADRDLVVAADDNLSAQFAQILHEIVGKRVVVVEDENHGVRDQDNALRF